MQPARAGTALRPAIAVALLLLGLVGLGLWRVVGGSSDLPYRSDAAPPAQAHVTAEHSYSLAVPGGVPTMLRHGVPVASSADGQLINLQCTYTAAATGERTLSVTAESTTTKAENTVGHFTAPITGSIHVDCDGWGAMFIPDSDDRATDWSGWALLLGTIALTVGAILALSAMYAVWSRSRAERSAQSDDELGATADDDQVEGFVDVAPAVRDDREVDSRDRGDVGE